MQRRPAIHSKRLLNLRRETIATSQARKTRLCRFQHDSQAYARSDVERETYKQGQDEGREWKNIVRQILVGKRAEETPFHLRYF